jgi:hypothetical protein
MLAFFFGKSNTYIINCIYFKIYREVEKKIRVGCDKKVQLGIR